MGRLKGDALTQYGLWLDYLDALEAVDYIGPVHAGFVTVAPSTPHDVWHGVAWVTDTAAQHAADVAAAEQKKSALRAATDAEIAWRQDAVDAGLVAEEETAALTEWKKYRVQLMRVNPEKPEWPPLPGAGAN